MERLIYDNFPRSGTNFLWASLCSAFPNSEIIWGGHRIESIRSGSNVITVIREPRECVPSWADFWQVGLPVEKYLDWYCRFAEATVENFDRIFAVSFDELINNTNDSLLRYSKKFNLFTPEVVSLSDVYSLLSDKPEHLPRKKSENRLRLEKEVSDLQLLTVAEELYSQVLSLISGES